MGSLVRLLIKLKNFFLGTEFCENCGMDLTEVKSYGFNELDHGGLGERKVCPSCGNALYL